MNSWQVLGIEPTADEAIIRRAYALKLKQHRPESDPEGYQLIREAFELAKSMASYQQEEVSVTDAVEPTANTFPIDESSPRPEMVENYGDPFAFQYSTKPLYTPEKLEGLAFELVDQEIKGRAAIATLFEHVTHQGTLTQQLQFHQDLAAALARQPGLTDGLVERISKFLGWGFDQYDSNFLVSRYYQDALYEQVRNTDREQAWKKIQSEKQNGGLLNRLALNLLSSHRVAAPSWVRLVPGAIGRMKQHTNALNATFPELVERLNPSMLDFINKPRYALSWQGIFLLVFWGIILLFLQHDSPLSPTFWLLSSGVVIYYLYLHDLILIGLMRRQRLAGCLLVLDCISSLLILASLFAGVLFNTASRMPSKGEGFSGMIPLFVCLIEWMVVWSVWPKHVPGIRRPGVAVARLLTSPWRLLKTLDFAGMSFPLAGAYGAFCYILLKELVKIADDFL